MPSKRQERPITEKRWIEQIEKRRLNVERGMLSIHEQAVRKNIVPEDSLALLTLPSEY